MEHRLDIDPILRRYCEDWSTDEGPELRSIERATHLNTVKRLDASDTLQGRILSLFSKLMQPRLIVEIGTFTAYATGCLAEGLHPDGKIITIESDEQYKDLIEKNLIRLEISQKIELRIGNALDELTKIDAAIDLLFIDAAKHEYVAYFDLVIDKIRSGGLIIADNVLWKRRVLYKDQDRMTRAMHGFNQKIAGDARVEVLILPYRDGISLIRKK